MSILELKTGSGVRLRSGGVAMTVAGVEAKVEEGAQTMAWVLCQWHTDNGMPMIGRFPIESLVVH